MTIAKLTLAALSVSLLLSALPASAANPESAEIAASSANSGIQSGLDPQNFGDQGVAVPGAESLNQLMALGSIFAGDMPAPGSLKALGETERKGETNIALAPDGAPPIAGHMAAGMPDMSKCSMPGAGMCKPGWSGKGGRRWCPLAMLDGPNALSDDQYQKLYDIKGQFIANVVPKGLNTYMMIRKMADLLTAADTDTKAVRDMERQIANATSDLSMTVMDSLISVNQVLTPGQRQELHRRMVRASVGGSPRNDKPGESHSEK